MTLLASLLVVKEVWLGTRGQGRWEGGSEQERWNRKLQTSHPKEYHRKTAREKQKTSSVSKLSFARRRRVRGRLAREGRGDERDVLGAGHEGREQRHEHKRY